jgi:hypothetical protein
MLLISLLQHFWILIISVVNVLEAVSHNYSHTNHTEVIILVLFAAIKIARNAFWVTPTGPKRRSQNAHQQNSAE